MAVKLANKGKYLAIVRLNSGRTYHLAPGETTPLLEELEVNGNKKISKLVNSGQLSFAAGEHEQG